MRMQENYVGGAAKRNIGEHPTRVVDGATPAVDFWPYVDAIPQADFGAHDFSKGEVSYAWNTGEDTWQHVLVRCDEPNVFLGIVLDLSVNKVLGHHLLDLNEHYGLNPN